MKETILTKIHGEHHELCHLLEKVESSRDYFRRLKLFNDLKSRLLSHMEREEVANIYNVVNYKHHEIKEYMQRLNLINFGSNRWPEVFKKFKEVVIQHCEEEEQIEIAGDPNAAKTISNSN